MKKIIYNLLFAAVLITLHHTATASAQRIPNGLVTLSTLTDLRAEVPQASEIVDLMGLSSITDGNGGSYFWNSTSTVMDDSFINIQVTGITTGRWQRIANNNTVKLNVSITPVLLQTAYPITFSTYSVTLPGVPVDIQVQPTSANGALLNYVTSKTATGFTINFLSVPVGTATFDVLVIKQ